MNHAINLDLGPESTFLGYPTQINGEKVCVLSPQVAEDRAIQVRVKRFMQGQGRDCETCGGCPVARAS